jgi:hypothetical protein
VPDPIVPPDDPYDHNLPPDAQIPYTRPTARFSGTLTDDTHGGLVGTGVMGGYAGYAFYEGNGEQLPDSIIESDLDARYGEGSTPAFYDRGYTRLSDFRLDRWQGAVPIFQIVAGHKTLKTCETVFGHWCDRTGVLTSSDYDWSALFDADLRGLLLGQKYRPAEVMDKQLRAPFNLYFFETDKLCGRRRGSVGPVATIPVEHLGWIPSDEESSTKPLSRVDSEAPTETELPRRIDFKYIDIEKDFEQGSQGDSRQVTQSEHVETIEVPLALYADEARAVTQRELYRAQIESEEETVHLDWSYIWLKPGDTIIVENGSGFTIRLFVKTIKPAIDVIEVRGVAEDIDLFDPNVSTSGGGSLTPPPVPIPGMTIVSFGDFTAWRTEDEGVPGYYVWVVKRTGDGAFTSAVLVKVIEGVPDTVATFAKEATAGTVTTKLGAVADTSVEDTTKTFTANATTDVLTSAAHGFEDDETVMFSNSGGALPAGLSNSTLYYVINSTANTFKVSLTAGGSAVNITSAGTGTNSVQRVIDTDLHGETATLESVTLAQIAQGANPCVFGPEVIQVRTWERVAGFANRWRGRNFTRGLRYTGPFVGAHNAGERFLLINDAVQFVTQGIGELGIERTYKAVTTGQSEDDAADVLYTWEGGALRYPHPGIQASRDTTSGDWRFLLFGTETTDPETERFKLEIVGSGRAPFVVRPAEPRAVSLSSTTALASDMEAPESGKGHYRAATLPGNSVTNVSAYVIQMIERERTVLSATWETALTPASAPASNTHTISFSPGGGFGITLTVKAKTSTDAGALTIADSGGVVFTDANGEALGTRYSVEFIDGKIKFYRNRSKHGEPFFTYQIPPSVLPDIFPSECHVVAGTSTSWKDIAIQDEKAALLYTEEMQTADFGSAQTSITVRGCQQRVVEGVVVDGHITEVSFP